MAEISELFKQTYKEWSSNKAPRLAAALAYNTLFALAPVLIIVIQIGALVLGMGRAGGHHHQLQATIVDYLDNTLGTQGAQAVANIVQGTIDKQSQGWVSGTVGWVLLVLAAGGLFSVLQDALNSIWEVPEPPSRGWRLLLQERLLSFLMLAGLAALVLAMSGANFLLGAFSGQLAEWLPGTDWLLRLGNLALTFTLTTLLFAFVFKYLPSIEVRWRDVGYGALLTALLFTLGQTLLSVYLASLASSSAYGAAGSLVALLVWVYYSAQILLFGACFTRVYAHRRGSRPDPLVDSSS